MTRIGALLAGLAVAGTLAGCNSLGGFAGAVAAVTTGAATSNPAVGVGVGVAVKSGTDAVVKKIFRDMQADEQNRIAGIAGAMKVGEERPWDISHTIPFHDERGEIRVVGVSRNAFTTCKEVMFSVVGGKQEAPTRQWFVTQTCRQPDGEWRWAAAEPAVGRWGSLQ